MRLKNSIATSYSASDKIDELIEGGFQTLRSLSYFEKCHLKFRTKEILVAKYSLARVTVAIKKKIVAVSQSLGRRRSMTFITYTQQGSLSIYPHCYLLAFSPLTGTI